MKSIDWEPLCKVGAMMLKTGGTDIGDSLSNIINDIT
jgi:hypothetical protein